MDVRLRSLCLLFLIFFTVSFFNLVQKQIFLHRKYVEEAKGQQVIKKEVASERGGIYTKEGEELYPLAINITYYSVLVVPAQITNKEKVSSLLAPILGLDEKELFNKINNNKLYLPPIARKVDQEKARQIQALNLKGVYLEEEKARFYPEGEVMAHILGFVNAEGDGQYGLEGYYDADLKGEKGVILGERDIKGRIIYYKNQQTPQPGASLITTIDRTIQWQAYNKIKEAVEKFKASSGSIIIMDPHTGAVMAMANYPSYDPNKFNEVKKEDHWIFQNPAIQKLYEPGSVFKVITMSAGIDSGSVTPETTEYFDAFVKIGGWTIWTWDKKPHGKQNMTQVLETSNNVGAVYVIQKVGKQLWEKYLKNFGFGAPLGIDLEKEVSKPLKPSKSWKDVELATMSFGQGISVTPLSVCSAVGAIANGGKLLRPYVVSEIVKPDGTKVKIQPKEISQPINSSTAVTVAEMMVSVVEKGHGKKARVPGFRIAGKTGTAQVPKKDGKGYEEGKTIGSFVGFGPVENPRFVMLVKIDEPKTVEWAESSAAPVFGEMANWLLKSYFKISPGEQD